MNDATTRMSILQKLSFEKHRHAAAQHGLEAREKQLAFWTELLRDQPDIGKLHEIGGEINDATTKAQVSYTQLLELNRRSVSLLRAYGDFLFHVMNREREADQVLTEADNIEAEESRVQRERQSDRLILFSADVNLNMTSENLGLIMVSDAEDSFGRVVSANSAALRIFGYAEHSLVGRSLSVLLPPPINAIHDLFLRRYMDTGRETMVCSYLLASPTTVG